MPNLPLNPKQTALLIADYYAEAVGTLPHAVQRNALQKTQSLQKAARSAGVLMCYCASVFRPGYPEISDRNKLGSQRKRSGQPAPTDPLQLIHPSVKPLEGEIVIGKHRTGAFYGTDLDLVLRANGVNTILILGYSTSGVVLATTRYAADLDYRILVVEDCCVEREPDVHDFLVKHIFPRQCEVVDSNRVIQALSQSQLS